MPALKFLELTHLGQLPAHAAWKCQDKETLVFEGRSFTFNQLNELVEKLAGGLRQAVRSEWRQRSPVVRKCLRKLPLVLGRQFSCPPGGTFLRRYMPDGKAWAGGSIALASRDGRLWETGTAYAESFAIKNGMLEFYDHNGLVAKAPLVAGSE